jgi:ATP-binding cassette subfamily F protein uup
LVSHDRAFLDNVVTQVIAFEGDGKLQEYVGGYEDWVRVQKYQAAAALAKPAATPPRPVAQAVEKPKASSKLNYKETQELEALPKRIEALEQEQIDIAAHLADGTIFRNDAKRAKQLQARNEAIEAEVLTIMARWEELEKRS